MEAFHYDRLAAIASSRAVWSEIDVLAFETVPRIDEARTIRRALSRLYKNQPLLGGQLQQSESASPPLERKAALASFVFPELKDGQLLSVPFDEEQTLHSDRNHTTPSHMVMGAIVEAALGDVVGGALPFDAIGINCTRPHIVRQLVAPLTKAVADAQVPFQPQPFLFVCPHCLPAARRRCGQDYPDSWLTRFTLHCPLFQCAGVSRRRSCMGRCKAAVEGRRRRLRL